jgi:hypothetical protein
MNTHKISQLTYSEAIDQFGSAIDEPTIGQIILRTTTNATHLVEDENIEARSTITVVKIDKIEDSSIQGTQICEFDTHDTKSKSREINGTCTLNISEINTSIQERIEEDDQFWSSRY